MDIKKIIDKLRNGVESQNERHILCNNLSSGIEAQTELLKRKEQELSKNTDTECKPHEVYTVGAVKCTKCGELFENNI